MRALEVFVNGQRVCLAGIECDGVMSAHVARVIGGQGRVEKIHLHVGGLEDGVHSTWSVPPVGVGDEVTIRIVNAPAVDPPSLSRTADDFEDDDDNESNGSSSA
jgi:hypothetical protein